jgi:tetratricopeptide (TPR) repeat protein
MEMFIGEINRRIETLETGAVRQPWYLPAWIRRIHRDILLHIARHAARGGNWSRAANCYRLLLTIKPNLPKIQVQYGHALKENGQLPEAAEAYRQALLYDPTNNEVSAFLDHILQQLSLRSKSVAIREAGTQVSLTQQLNPNLEFLTINSLNPRMQKIYADLREAIQVNKLKNN